MMKKTLLLLLCITVLSCATLQQKRFAGSVEDVIEYINAGQASELSNISQTPFLLDAEIILLKEDVMEFWGQIVKVGFQIQEYQSIASVPITSTTYKDFADTMEVQSFFEKYISKRAYLVTVKTDHFSVYFITDRVAFGEIKILGMKGPEAS
jgi:hypothetical protein